MHRFATTTDSTVAGSSASRASSGGTQRSSSPGRPIRRAKCATSGTAPSRRLVSVNGTGPGVFTATSLTLTIRYLKVDLLQGSRRKPARRTIGELVDPPGQ